jgi:hypothetical protein
VLFGLTDNGTKRLELEWDNGLWLLPQNAGGQYVQYVESTFAPRAVVKPVDGECYVGRVVADSNHVIIDSSGNGWLYLSSQVIYPRWWGTDITALQLACAHANNCTVDGVNYGFFFGADTTVTLDGISTLRNLSIASFNNSVLTIVGGGYSLENSFFSHPLVLHAPAYVDTIRAFGDITLIDATDAKVTRVNTTGRILLGSTLATPTYVFNGLSITECKCSDIVALASIAPSGHRADVYANIKTSSGKLPATRYVFGDEKLYNILFASTTIGTAPAYFPKFLPFYANEPIMASVNVYSITKAGDPANYAGPYGTGIVINQSVLCSVESSYIPDGDWTIGWNGSAVWSCVQ